MKNTETKQNTEKPTSSKGKVLSGKVVSTKMKDTIVVSVNRFVKHPKYGKYFQVSKRYKAHDTGNTKKEGETVSIVEVAPISKDKHFKVI
ncbi:MAG: 30S ribosomal protein S17 [Parcubacteria group bacterium]|nr:30S ribosomal protein S17 [Parcubacteria group bacterium]